MPKSHSHVLRKGRHSEAGRIYLLTTVTRARRPLFFDLSLGRVVVHAMRHQERQQRVESLAFVVMPDHLHWLMVLQSQSSLAEVMKSMKSWSARRIGEILRQRGEDESAGIWQAGFHDHALRKEEDLAATARYLVANPLRAGLVRSVGDYPLWDAIWLEG